MISYRNYHIAIGKRLLWQLAVDIRFASGLLGYGNGVEKQSETHEIKKPRIKIREKN